MIKIVDMKRPPEKIKETKSPSYYEGDRYPYGLQITLNKQEISKLGLDLTKIKVGEQVKIEAFATVTAIRATDSLDSSSKTVELQIKKMGCDAGGEKKGFVGKVAKPFI